jgi:hypothetical protein
MNYEKELLIEQIHKLDEKRKLSETVGPDYFEPGKMEYLEEYKGDYDDNTGSFLIRFESKGTRYNGRTEQIEKVKAGDSLEIRRDPENQYNKNNFLIYTKKGFDVGNMPAELCNVIAPLYDSEKLVIDRAAVSFADPISKRSRYAKQAVLFVEVEGHIYES